MGFVTATNHREAISQISTQAIERVHNERYREIETTGEYYMVEDQEKGGKTFIFEIQP